MRDQAGVVDKAWGESLVLAIERVPHCFGFTGAKKIWRLTRPTAKTMHE
jgi:hypothetical protein